MARNQLLQGLQLFLMAFWCLFYGVVVVTNGCDVLHRKHPGGFGSRFRAQNFEEVEAAVATVLGPPKLASYLFALVISGQVVGFALFAWALCSALAPQGVRCALLWNVALWQAFVVADSLFRTYQFTVVHTVLLCTGLLTALVFLM